MGALADSFDTLADSDMWMDVAILFGAFAAGTVARNLIEPNTPWDLPDEVYGVLVVLGAGYLRKGRTWLGSAAVPTSPTRSPSGSI